MTGFSPSGQCVADSPQCRLAALCNSFQELFKGDKLRIGPQPVEQEHLSLGCTLNLHGLAIDRHRHGADLAALAPAHPGSHGALRVSRLKKGLGVIGEFGHCLVALERHPLLYAVGVDALIDGKRFHVWLQRFTTLRIWIIKKRHKALLATKITKAPSAINTTGPLTKPLF